MQQLTSKTYPKLTQNLQSPLPMQTRNVLPCKQPTSICAMSLVPHRTSASSDSSKLAPRSMNLRASRPPTTVDLHFSRNDSSCPDTGDFVDKRGKSWYRYIMQPKQCIVPEVHWQTFRAGSHGVPSPTHVRKTQLWSLKKLKH